MTKPTLSTTEAAELLGVSEYLVKDIIRRDVDGQLSFTIGRRRLIRRHVLLQMFELQEPERQNAQPSPDEVAAAAQQAEIFALQRRLDELLKGGH